MLWKGQLLTFRGSVAQTSRTREESRQQPTSTLQPHVSRKTPSRRWLRRLGLCLQVLQRCRTTSGVKPRASLHRLCCMRSDSSLVRGLRARGCMMTIACPALCVPSLVVMPSATSLFARALLRTSGLSLVENPRTMTWSLRRSLPKSSSRSRIPIHSCRSIVRHRQPPRSIVATRVRMRLRSPQGLAAPTVAHLREVAPERDDMSCVSAVYVHKLSLCFKKIILF